MAVGLTAPEYLAPVAGVRLAATAAGIRARDRDDLALLELAPGTQAAAVFTRNAFAAAPVTLAREFLRTAPPRYLLINSGNANAGTGAAGERAARDCCEALAGLAGCAPQQVLPFSTGVIGELLPAERIVEALPALLDGLRADGWLTAARAIMTTDTVPKGFSETVDCGAGTVTITGIAKGSGMIRPDMATMLGYITTDACFEAVELRELLAAACESSFNRITVDGDMSTNDACVLAATGASGVTPAGTGRERLAQALQRVCTRLAQALVRDGEGATRFVTLDIIGGRDSGECLRVGRAIAHSPLVKTALFAGDANWGRILAAVGYAGVDGLDVGRVDIHLGEVCIVAGGGRAPGYEEAQGAAVMARPEIDIRVDLGRGSAAERLWTCDLSHDYIRINAEYRS